MAQEIDVRGPRFSAVLTFVLLSLAFLFHSGLILAVQTVVFLIGAFRGPHKSPFGILFAKVIKPLLSPTTQTEDSRPPQFAQSVGAFFGVVGLLGFVIGSSAIFTIATGFALAASFLNAFFGLCLGCKVYLGIKFLTQPRKELVEA